MNKCWNSILKIVVRVTDENDNSPKFIGNGKPIVAVIPNTANFGFPVTRVEATDDDIGLNSEIRYSLLNEPTKLFEIDEMSGSIRVIGPIGNDQRVYGFDVKATDRKGADDGKSTIVNVFVRTAGFFNFQKQIFFSFICIRFNVNFSRPSGLYIGW